MSSRDQLHAYLQQVEKRLRLGVLLQGFALLASVALVTTVVLVLFTNALAFSPGSLAGARVILFCLLALTLGFGIVLPLIALNPRRTAGRAEAVFPQFQQRLMTFADREHHGSEPFIELLAADTLELAGIAPPSRVAPGGKLLLSFTAAGACLGVLVWMILAGPGYFGYGARRLWAGSPRGTAVFYDIRVSPGNAAIRRNGSQVITAQLIGFDSPQARLRTRYLSASKWDETTMQLQPGAAGFQFFFASIPEDLEYYVEAGQVHSHHFRIRVIDLPSIKQIRITYRYPAWTGLQNVVEGRGGDLRAVEGTAADLAVLTDRPMRAGVLVLNNGQEIPLAGSAGNVYQGTIGIEKDGSYHVAAVDRGRLVRLSDDFFIEARKPNPPEVAITRPGRDYQASPIEEVTVRVHANDDYGLKGLGLHYSVNGGSEQTVNMLAQKGAKEAQGSTILHLEDFKVVPGDVVSVYAKAKDGRTESRTAMFFIETEPFEREYSQSQLAGGGGMGAEQNEISQREKEIIAATWSQQGNTQSTQREAAGTANFLASVQGKLRDQALSLAGRLQQRELVDENEEFGAFQQDMSAAAQAMNPAVKSLRHQKWSEAVFSEEKALQQLLRAEATFRQIQVAFGGQGGGGAGAGRDLANLVDLELNTEKNQYETGQTAESAQQRAQQTDKAFQKLDELAHREQELAGQQRSNPNQDFHRRWQQEMLRREAQQLQKQLEQLAQGNGQGQQGSPTSGSQLSNGESQGATGEPIQRIIDQLRQASQDMRRAASSGQASADARRAASRLEEATKLLGGVQHQQVSPQLDSLAREANRLADQERGQAARIRKMFGDNRQMNFSAQTDFDGGDMEQSKLADERQLLANDLSRLEKAMQEAAHELGPTQPGAASKLHQALGEMDEAELRARLERSADAIRLGIDPGSKTIEPAIAAGIERLGEGVHEAQRALTLPQQNPEEEALNRVARLRSEIEALTHPSGNASPENGQPNQQSQAGQEAQRGQQSQQALSGKGNESADSNSGFQSGAPGGPRTWQARGGPGTYIEPPGEGGEPATDSSASAELALRQAQRELQGLRRVLQSKPESLAQIQQLMRAVQRLGPGNFPGNPALVEQLRAQALTTVDRLELQLRRELDDEQSGQVRNGDFLRVPQGYQESVAEYFRRLSKAH